MPNAPAPNGETPLMMAALSGRRPMVELLLKSGADVGTRDTKGQTAADWARTGKSTALAAQLDKLIAQQDEARSRRRAGVEAAPAAEAPAAPAPAPAAEAQAPAASSGAVQGVSGLKLNNYDEPAAP